MEGNKEVKECLKFPSLETSTRAIIDEDILYLCSNHRVYVVRVDDAL
jgi:hypothetical protein